MISRAAGLLGVGFCSRAPAVCSVDVPLNVSPIVFVCGWRSNQMEVVQLDAACSRRGKRRKLYLKHSLKFS